VAPSIISRPSTVGTREHSKARSLSTKTMTVLTPRETKGYPNHDFEPYQTKSKKEDFMKVKSAKTALSTAIILPLLILSFSVAAIAGVSAAKPKLVLQITIDQMRGDYPMRYKDRLGEGGFRYLMKKGIHYSNAHFQHADTETPIGHAALFTGTYPAHNGIVAGNWYDTSKGHLIYNCPDHRQYSRGQTAVGFSRNTFN